MPSRFAPSVPLFTRRALLRAGAALGLAAVGARSAFAQAAAPAAPAAVDIAGMKPGQFVWYPERAPDGFVTIVVSLTDQRCYVYRNGVRIGVSTVSTGRQGHDTPVGVFTILQKDADHHSSLYDDASMPFTERLTWSGVALHAGIVPGYPSSHGCIHLPLAFAKLLFGITHYGTPVIVCDSSSEPQDVLHPGLVLSSDAEKAAQDAVAKEEASDASAAAKLTSADLGAGAVSMVVSGADKTITVLKGGEVALTAPVTIRDPGTPLGNVVYVLKSTNGDVVWTAISYEGNGAAQGQPASVIDRITVSPEANKELAALMVPGSTLLVTDLPAHPGTRTGKDFVVMTHLAS